MPRNLAAPFTARVQAAALIPIFLAKFSFASGDLNLWSGVGVLGWNGELYYGSGGLGTFSAIVESGATRAGSVTFSLSGADQQIIALALNEEYQNRPASLWFAVLDDNYALVSTPYLLYRGKMDVMTINESGDTSTVELTVENDLVILRRPQERRYTDEDQRQDYPDDTMFSRVADLQDKEILFGKAEVGGAVPIKLTQSFAKGSSQSADDVHSAPGPTPGHQK